jgi:hypothetical protein
LLQRGDKRPQEERRGCSCGVLLLFGGGCSGENCSGSILISAERLEFHGEKTVWFLLRWYSKYAEHLRKRFFFAVAVFYSRRAFCSAGNPSPRGNPGLKCTRTDNILKKFEFKMNFE